MKLQKYVVEIEFFDRTGFAYDVLALFDRNYIDKSSLEVLPQGNGRLIMVVQFSAPPWLKIELVQEELGKIEGALAVRLRDYMPYEEKEQQLQTVLNAVNEGVIALNRDGKITHINHKAASIFRCQPEEVIGQPANRFFPEKSPIFTVLESGRGSAFSEQSGKLGGRLFQFFMSCTPIINKQGLLLGVVATIQDYRQVEEIVSKVNQKHQLLTFDGIVHQSPALRQSIATAKIVAAGDSTVLLQGESGTGKELFARAIHTASNRAHAPFVAINCGAVPDTLLESELFGYEEGTFTGASKGGKKGVFELAQGGTIFLDEIGEVSPAMQVRLLRVLQEHTIRRIGGARELPLDVRIIAATNQDLAALVTDRRFRQDLYYRLAVIPIRIPPLRERREDIPLLAQYLTRKLCFKLGKTEKTLSGESLAMLATASWPGNVRQLENLLELAVNLAESDIIQPKDFGSWLEAGQPIASAKDEAEPQSITIPVPADGRWQSLKDIVREVEHQVILRVMEKENSSRKIGAILGVSNTTILNKIHQWTLDSQTKSRDSK